MPQRRTQRDIDLTLARCDIQSAVADMAMKHYLKPLEMAQILAQLMAQYLNAGCREEGEQI